jgi:hypothetical protein
MLSKEETDRKKLSFKIGDYFPADDSGTNLILPLLMSCNDLIYVNQLWVIESKLVKGSEKIDTNSAAATAKSFYSFRLLCSHLREAVKTLNAAENEPNFKKIMAHFSKEGKEKLMMLHGYYEPFENSFTKKFLVPIRNTLFHYYNDKKAVEAIKKCLSSLKEERTSILVEEKREGLRLLVADDIVVCHVGEIIKEIGLTLPEAMSKVFEMAKCTLDVIEHLHIAYLEMKGFSFGSD